MHNRLRRAASGGHPQRNIGVGSKIQIGARSKTGQIERRGESSFDLRGHALFLESLESRGSGFGGVFCWPVIAGLIDGGSSSPVESNYAADGQPHTGFSSSVTGEVITRNTRSTIPEFEMACSTPGGRKMKSCLRTRWFLPAISISPSPSSTW
jgi:hypothetical protein